MKPSSVSTYLRIWAYKAFVGQTLLSGNKTCAQGILMYVE